MNHERAQSRNLSIRNHRDVDRPALAGGTQKVIGQIPDLDHDPRMARDNPDGGYRSIHSELDGTGLPGLFGNRLVSF
jgi:hypothetical protein